MLFKIAFIVAMCAAGITEWLKNLIPAKVKESNVFMAIIAGVIAALGGAAVAFIPGLVSQFTGLTLVPKLIFVIGVVALTQTSYTLLFQTFKAVKAKLTSKVGADPDTLAEEIANKVTEEVTKLAEK